MSEAERAAIAAFTTGAISRESPIRVQFASPLAEAGQLHAPLARSPFSFAPAIAGVAVWTSPGQIEFRPSERLKDGQDYSAVLDVRALARGQLPLERFEFAFTALRQSFEVAVDGLEAAGSHDVKAQKLTGTLLTADVEDASRVEGVLRATHAGAELAIAWSHEPDRRTHRFSVGAIVRGEEPSELRLSWDGSPIGVDKREERELPVPGLNSFAVSQARAVQGRQQYVELRFSDPLRTPQNLEGLIQVPGYDDLRFSISGSIVEVYSARGFRGEQAVRVAAGIRNTLGFRLREGRELPVNFEAVKPQVRIAGKGAILPTSAGLTVPIEAVNLSALVVEAIRIPDSALPQFLQVNDLSGDRELARVGRVVWRATVPLEVTPDKQDRWLSFGLDLAPLTKAHTGGLYRLGLSFKRPHVLWPCPGQAEPPPDAAEPAGPAAEGEAEASFWDAWESDEAGDWNERYENRDNPCHPAYYKPYYDHDVRVGRNVLVSDIGLIAKAGEDESMTLFATDIRTAAPLHGAEITLRDYQQQPLASGRTDAEGRLLLRPERKPFLAVARNGAQAGYLRLDDGGALSMSHFDVSGVRAPKGVKGFLYGERGVWRPGDTLHLGFLLLDPARRLAPGHPLRFELIDGRGRVARTLTRAAPADGLQTFEVATDADAPTGNYTGRVSVGGASFERTLKIETVMPNRLKIALDFGPAPLAAGPPLGGVLRAGWLHGGAARGLKADVELALRPSGTRFPRYAGYVFDDPTRKFESDKQLVFEGALDDSGTARVEAVVAAAKAAPGRLDAHFTTRVFEPGGAFSIDRFSVPYSPYARYVGVRTPRGDAARGMILTDTRHTLEVALVDAEGRPAGDGEVEVKLYKVGWRWWWERGEEDLSAYAEASVQTPLLEGVVPVKAGAGSWQFEIKYPDWGRYLITAADRSGGHRTGKLLYIDWPGWAGRDQKEMGGGASVLGFAADRPEYSVGDTVTLTIPTPRRGRALVSIESGSRVLATAWLDAAGSETRYTFPATAEMAPNVYAHVTLLQPHAQTGNDLPIRLYGVAPVKVVDPRTRLKPVLECADVFAPESTASVSVREASGRPMSYTLAVVDEGLLGLTRYQAPDPWDYFYAREALAVKTWDLFDHVIGAHGAAIERMLAIGGGDEGLAPGARRANRFPPMVHFLGPFQLARGASRSHALDIPRYVGAARVMVVAGRDGAFGAVSKSVQVRRPLMLLGTLPRVLGPGEEVALPVSVFALEPSVREVTVSLEVSGPLAILGPSTRSLSFRSIGDELVAFKLGARPVQGVARVVIKAAAGAERAEQRIELDVRSRTARAVDVLGATLKPGDGWRPALAQPGLPGTNEATLEVSRVPPLDLGRRLEYLTSYPHGCLEQTVSAAFPQLFLGRLLELSPERQARVEANVKAAIERLARAQVSDGGFAYWQGHAGADEWSTSYAGHFLVEAQKAGYLVSAGLLDQWKSYERRRARGWVAGGRNQDELLQAYRLYALSLAAAPELGAMNLLRERELPVAAKWRLAAAYQLAGQPEAARALAARTPVAVKPYRELSFSFGSDLRDRAMILEAALALDMPEHVGPLVKSVSDSLAKNDWLSTQETAFALLALARAASGPAEAAQASFSYAWNGAAAVPVATARPVFQIKLPATERGAWTLELRNTGNAALYPRLVLSGLPPAGQESAASNGLKLEVEYASASGGAADPDRLEQGSDLKVIARVTNLGTRGDLRHLALAHLFPSGWEIRNERLDGRRPPPGSPYEHQDVRDDRVYSYLDLKSGETKSVEVLANASYLGRFYLPMVSAEAMYDATINARVKGRWIQVVPAGAP